jgi:RNA polymerase sigma factor (TIGR02999 family)
MIDHGALVEELQRISNNELRGDAFSVTGQLHRAFVRLAEQDQITWQNRIAFFLAAAAAMRRILVERERKAGSHIQLTLADDLAGNTFPLAFLDEVLEELGSIDEQRARLVELRYFGGLSLEETAQALSIHIDDAKKVWIAARVWLKRKQAT